MSGKVFGFLKELHLAISINELTWHCFEYIIEGIALNIIALNTE